MEKKDFLYNFTNIYLAEAVKETVLIENWEEKDFDHRYVEYVDVFTKVKNEIFEKKTSRKEALFQLLKNKKNIVSIFNDTITKHFMDELSKKGFNNKTQAKNFIKRNFPIGDKINPDTLRVFRDYEEYLYNQEQGA